MKLVDYSAQMLRCGERRIAVVQGEPTFIEQAITQFQQQLAGDWLLVAEQSLAGLTAHAPSAFRTLLGREVTHGIFDARAGLHSEALAALSGTLVAGSWLLLLLPTEEERPSQPDNDSLRWAEVDQPIATPHFMHHLQHCLKSEAPVAIWRQGEPLQLPPCPEGPGWQTAATQEQEQVLAQIGQQRPRIAIVTAARGRGKSALAGLLAAQYPGTIITAPAKVSTRVLKQFAGDNFHFVAPDALVSQGDIALRGWLVIDEAAAIPTALLQRLIKLRQRVLLLTTTEGYEGTGQGFLLKFCANLNQAYCHYRLYRPLRWRQGDPLEAFIDRLLLLTVTQPPATTYAAEGAIVELPQHHWQHDLSRFQSLYGLLKTAHYRTSPLDLRRMFDAPGLRFWVMEREQECQAALWLNEEGGLSEALSWAVWAGWRRPKGNLVAQSLAAHSHFPQAAQLYSLRINRIAVAEPLRRHGIGQQLIREVVKHASGLDYLSVSFGFTAELYHFWRSCGFRLVRIGSQPEASSGHYAAMALLPLTAAGERITEAAALSLARDWPWLAARWFSQLDLEIVARVDQTLNHQDWQLLAGFAWASRPFSACYAALQRAWQQCQPVAQRWPLLHAWLSATGIEPTGNLGRKRAIQQLRLETAELLAQLDPRYSLKLQEWIASLRQEDKQGVANPR